MTAEQLKASILQMAIEGKLVPQLDDEPAVDIEAVEPEEVPFAIPEKWKWVTVQDAMESISTGPFGSMLHKTDYVTDGIPVINPANLATGSIVPSQSMMVSAETVARLSSYCLHTGMVVMGRRGEMGRCAEVTEKEDGWLCGTGSFFMKPNFDLVAKFVCLFFSTGYARNYLMGESVGTTMSNLNHKILKRLPMPIPPKAEQVRILARLNEILPLIEEYGKAHSALKNAEEALPDQLRASLLQEAIQGKLVPQLDDEPAVDMAGEEPDEVPFAIPDKWKWVRLGDCTEINPKVSADDDSDVSFVPMPLLQAGYGNSIDTSNKRKWKEVKKGFTKFCDGDVVLAKITPCFENRKSAIVSNAINGIGTGTTELHVFRCKNSLLPEFLLMFFKSAYLIQYGVEHFKGTAGQQRIGTADLKVCPIPLPPLAEQRRIVARLEELLPHVDTIAGLR